MATKNLNIVYAADTSQISRALRSIDDDNSRLGSSLMKVGNLIGTGLTAAGAAAGAAAIGLGAAFVGVAKKGMDMNAELETSTKMFTTLMGDAGKAEAHVKSLFKFAAATPFETGPIITASKHMQTFGGAALNTEKNLKLVGDAAAATGTDISEVGFWVGRAYSMIQGGKPFGEAAMRLQEMGILSSEARTRMEELQKSGADTTVVWGEMQKEMAKFNGAMIEQATTWKGISSTLQDTFAMGAQRMTQPMFEGFKNLASAFNEFAQTPAWEEIIQKGEGIFNFLGGGLDKLAEALRGGGLQGALTEMKGWVLGAFAALTPEALVPREKWLGIWDVFKDTGSLKTALSGVGPTITTSLTDSFSNVDYNKLVDPVTNGIRSVLEKVPWGPMVNTMAQSFLRTMGSIDWAGLILTGIAIFDQIVRGMITGIIDAFRRDPMTMITTIAGILLAPGKWVAALAGGLGRIPFVGTLFEWMITAIRGVGDMFMGPLRSNFSKWFDEAVEAVGKSVGRIGKTMRAWIGDLAHPVVDAGEDVVRGLWRGISGMGGWITSRLWDWVRRHVPGPIKKALGIESPSKVFMGIGRNVVQGLAFGITDNQTLVRRAMAQTARNLQALNLPGVNLGSVPDLRPSIGTARRGDGGDSLATPMRPLLVEVPVNIDGKEVARVITPHVTDEQIKFGKRNRTIFGGVQ